MSALQLWLQNHNRRLTQDAIDEALMEYITHVEKQRDELLVKVAAWEQKAANWMASPEAAQRLDGYRDLAQRLNIAEQQRDELLAEFNAYKEGSEEAFGTVVAQKQAAEARLQTMQSTITSQQGVICDFREQRDKLLAALEKFIAWNKAYPSSRIYSATAIRVIAKELDQIADQAEAAIASVKGGSE